MSSLWSDLRYSLRLFLRQPLFSLTVVLALALGIGVNSGIFSVVDHVLLKPLPYRDPGQLYYLWCQSPRTNEIKDSLSAGDFQDIKASATSFESMAAWFVYSATLTGLGEPVRLYTSLVSPGYFATLGIRPYLGADFEERHGVRGSNSVALLSYAFWKRQFGSDPSIVGRSLMLEGEPHLVLGVLPEIKGETRAFDAYVPYAFTPEVLEARNSRHLTTIVRLKPGVAVAQAEAELRGLGARLAAEHPQTNRDWSFFLTPAKEEVTGASRQALFMLAAAVGFILLITCANLASLLLVRAAGRAKEVAIRTALGARPGHIVRQMLTESLLYSLMGGALGLLLAALTLHAVKALAPANIPRLQEAHLDGSTLLFTFALSLLTGLLFGSTPAFQTLRVRLGTTLREESRGSSSGMARSRVRAILVIAEVAMAAILLAGSGLLVRSLFNLSAIELGFQPAGVLTARTTLAEPRFPKPENRADYGRRILDRLKTEPGVTGAAITLALPMMQVDWKAEFTDPGGGSNDLRNAESYSAVSPDYFSTLGIVLKSGRAFTERDTLDSPPVIIVSEAFVRRYFSNVNPLGKGFSFKVGMRQVRAEIVGIAANVKHLRPDEPANPAIYQPYAQQPWPYLAFAIRTSRDPVSIVAAVRRAFAEVDDQQPIDRVMPLARLLDSTLAQKRLAMTMLLAFAGLAVVLVSLGLYGLLAYSVAQRTREMGIRTALGARPADVTMLVARQGMLLTLGGILAGLLVTPLASGTFHEMLYNVKPWDPLTFLCVAALLLAVAALACWAPALRASRTDPARALRCD